MPSLFRFIITLAILAGLAYGAMYALVLYVEPKEREVTIRVPRDKIELQRIIPEAPDATAQDDRAAQ
jgi:hypothetical protein